MAGLKGTLGEIGACPTRLLRSQPQSWRLDRGIQTV